MISGLSSPAVKFGGREVESHSTDARFFFSVLDDMAGRDLRTGLDDDDDELEDSGAGGVAGFCMICAGNGAGACMLGTTAMGATTMGATMMGATTMGATTVTGKLRGGGELPIVPAAGSDSGVSGGNEDTELMDSRLSIRFDGALGALRRDSLEMRGGEI